MTAHDDLAKSQLFDVTREVVIDSGGFTGSGPATAKARLQAGTILDSRYKIISVLGVGGMGAVYRAQHLALDKEVALKTLLSENMSEEAWTRFQREARALAQLNHKNIVQVFDFGVSASNVPFYTMECLAGKSLAEDAGEQGQSLRQILDTFIQVGEALAVAHRKNIIHRDVKPANIFLAREKISSGQKIVPKVVDFGIAALATSADEDQQLTEAGRVFGSPLYMSPEQARGEALGPQSDIYSYACTLFEILSGAPPFRGANPFLTMMMHQKAPVPSLKQFCDGQLPQRLSGLIERMLAKRPADRPASFDTVISELETINKALGNQQIVVKRSATSSEGGDTTGGVTTSAPGLKRAKMLGFLATALVITLGGGAIYATIHKSAKQPPQVKAQKTAINQNLSDDMPADATAFTQAQAMVDAQKPVDTRKPPKTIPRYLQTIKNGRTYFNFPNNGFKVGAFCISPDGGKTIKSIPAVGQVNFATSDRLEFLPGEDVSQFPKLMDGFGANEIKSIRFLPHLACSDANVDHIKQIKGLEHLCVRSTEIDDVAVDIIDLMPKIDSLHFSHTAVTIARLCKADGLYNLKTLLISDMRNVGPLLQALLTVPSDRSSTGRPAPNTKLSVLALSNCDLTDADIATLSKLSRLGIIDLSKNLRLTNQGVSSLAQLQELQQLDISLTKIDSASATQIAKIPNLQTLIVTRKNWPMQSVAALRRMKPSLSVQFSQDLAADLIIP